MIAIDETLTPADLLPKLDRFWELSGEKIRLLGEAYDRSLGAPVYTVQGRYTSRGWTEWTQGFEYGSELLQYDATGDEAFLAAGRQHTVERMAPHVTHFGVHDHGFNIVSTYGNLLRLLNEGRLAGDDGDRAFYEMALKCSAAVQARRWTRLPKGHGYIYSFNGPHSLFADTMRSLRSLAIGHQLDQPFLDEQEAPVSLLVRLLQHARTTATYTVYYGEGRDAYDERGRVAHESIFNPENGSYRCPSSQQGYSPFSTWTRGLAWVLLGYAEQLEFIRTLDRASLAAHGGWDQVTGFMLKAARATADYYIARTPSDGIPYWDTGAPELHRIDDALRRPADPFNAHEPVDSSAAAIAAQGLLRLGAVLEEDGAAYVQAGLTVLDTLLDEPYLSTAPGHQGLILHSLYHRPNGWDHIPEGHRAPCGEASMWGDYHAREAALYVQRLAKGEPYYAFFLDAEEGASRR